MKEFYENVKKNAYVGSKVILQKTKQAVDRTKVEIDLHKLQYDITQLYKKIGRLTYVAYRDGLDDTEETIEAYLKLIEEKEKRIKEAQHKNHEQKQEEKVKTEDELPQEQEEGKRLYGKIAEPVKNQQGFTVMRFCKHCQVGNHPEAIVCVQCGEKL